MVDSNECTSLLTSVLPRLIPKGTVPFGFGCSVVPVGSAQKSQCALWVLLPPLEVLEVVRLLSATGMDLD